MNPVIDARGIGKIYDGGTRVEALKNVDLRVEPGTFVSIMGPSGSGKSTLLNILGALEPATSGSLVIDGRAIETLDDDERTLFRRRRIGFVFQQFNLLPIYSAAENVALPLRLDGVSTAKAMVRATELLEQVQLSERRNSLPGVLSGGEQQRVAIARALVMQPSIILADEPTGSLDSVSGMRVLAILRKLVDEQRQTVVMVTHDASLAAHSDRVVAFRDGEIIDDFDPRERDLAALTSGRPVA